MSSLQNIIAEADRGQLLDDADLAIREILSVVETDFDRTGEVTIKLKIGTQNGVVVVGGEMTHKLSKPKRLATVMFLTDEGELSRRDPRQPAMPVVTEADELNRRRAQPSGEPNWQTTITISPVVAMSKLPSMSLARSSFPG